MGSLDRGERDALLTRNANGEPLGCPIFLSEEELIALGIDLDGATRIDYWIEDGQLRLEPLKGVADDN